MSEIQNIIGDSVQDRAASFTTPVKNLMTGTTFSAEIDPVQDIELNTALGRDARESVKLHVSDRPLAMRMNLNDELQFKLYGQMAIYKILRRTANDASPLVEFGCMKKTDKDN